MVSLHRIGRRLGGVSVAIGLSAVAFAHAQAQRKLVMYCGVNEEWCRAMATAFEQQTGIQVDMTRRAPARSMPACGPRRKIRAATSGRAAPAIRICRRRTRA